MYGCYVLAIRIRLLIQTKPEAHFCFIQSYPNIVDLYSLYVVATLIYLLLYFTIWLDKK